MKEAADNPPENKLLHGVSDEALCSAVEASGYPLQVLAGARLRAQGFLIAEEWVFNDRDTGQLRALDIHALLPLYDWEADGGRRVRPQLALLVECKQSEMPYVFFVSDARPGVSAEAVAISGLHSDRVEIHTDDDASTWSFSVPQTLGLADHAFVAEPHCVALSFSKAARKNKDLTLSGSDPYQSLVLPLTKALDSYSARVAPPTTARYFDLTVPFGLAVIDGPMVAAEVSPSATEYRLTPWVRVYRHDVDPAAAHHFDREKLFAIDCVHSAWLDQYLNNHLLPFARELGRRALAHHEEIASGSAFAAGFARDSRGGLPERLQPLSMAQRARRPATVLRHIGSNVRGAVRHRKSR